jgi:uncharacterized RDD family membrane protein YckC
VTAPAHRSPSAARGVVTPEAVVLDFDTAGVPSRAVARVIDTMVAAVVGLTLLATVLPALGPGGAARAAAILITFAAVFGYPAVLETASGRTVGKSILGLRVITEEGGPIGFRHAAIRSAMQVVDLFLVPIGGVAIVSSLAGRRDQRLGDRLAGTIVVRSASLSMRARAVGFPPLPGYEGYVAGLDVGAITPERYEVLRAYLTRVDELTPAARRRLADRLAGAVAELLGHHRPSWVHPEAFLASVAAAYQQRHGGPATWMWGPWASGSVPAPAPAPGVPGA